MKRSSGSIAHWMASFETALLQLNSESFLDHLDSKSVARLERTLFSALLSVRTWHNAHRPINRLPAEITANIFLYVQEYSQGTFPDHKFRHKTRSAPSPRADIMSVCRHWRDMMLTYRALWGTLIIPDSWFNTNHVTYIKHCLKQSGSSPLNVYANTPTWESLEQIVAQSSRLRVLHLRFDGSYSMDRYLGDFHDPAPSLECLHIQNDSLQYRGADLPLLFNGQAPGLRQLGLYGISSWIDNNFTALTHLTIDGPENFLPHSQTVEQLFGLLRMNPGVEEINFSNMQNWFSMLADEMHVHLPIDLRQLQRLSLRSCSPFEAANFLTHLRLPSGASMSLSLVSSPFHDNAFNFLPYDTSGLPNLLQITALTLHELSASRTVIWIGRGTSSGMKLRHYVQDDGDDYDEGVMLQQCAAFYEESIVPLSLLPFVGQLRELWLTSDAVAEDIRESDVPDLRYHRLFRATLSLTELHLSGGNVWNIIEALRPKNYTGVPVAVSQHLQTLTVTVKENDLVRRDVLLACVKQRAESGYPIRRLSIFLPLDYGEPGDVEFLEDLRRYVDVVDPDLDVQSNMEIPEDWGARRHSYWPEWTLAPET